MPVGQTPLGFKNTLSGQGQPGDWKIILDEGPSLLPPISAQSPVAKRQPVLAQLARDKTDEHFPLLIYQEQEFDDFTLSTRFKLVDGETEQMAGLAFRIKDERNYYYVRASGLGGTFNFFKIVDGVRSPPIGAKVQVPKGVWHKLTVQCRGSEIRALLNDQELIPPLGDKSFASGKVGLWTKSDSVSHFSNLQVIYQPKVIYAQRLVRQVLDEYPRLLGLRLSAPAKGNTNEISLIASGDPKDLGQPASPEARDVIARGIPYCGKSPSRVTVILPLRDRNGDPMAAVTVIMKGFPGQTEKNALSRALPVVQQMQSRVRRLEELYD